MGKTHSKARRRPQQEITDEVAARRNALFDELVKPYLRMVYKLCIRYTFDPDDIQDNYVEVLTNMYKYIETYDYTHDIKTWIHIVTKRFVFNSDKRKSRKAALMNDEEPMDYMKADEFEYPDSPSANIMNMDNYKDLYNDDILAALEELKPQYRRCLLYQQAGYKLREIADLEYQNGALESRNIETIKSRLFLARQQLQTLLTRDGNRRPTGEENQDDIFGDY